MKLAKTFELGGGKLSLPLAALAFACSFNVAFADSPDYSTYVRLENSDTVEDKAASTSWKSALHWSDHLEPSSSKNYYVPAGKILVHHHTKDNAAANTWNGGQLAVAGTFHAYVSIGNNNGCLVPDLVLLPGSEVRADCYGPFYIYNSTTSRVTVAGTMENPSVISQHYYNPDKARNHSIYANFVGTSSSALVFTRPTVNYKGNVLGKGHPFYCYLHDFPFRDYSGTFILRGSNTRVRLAEARTFNWPNTALRLEDDAILTPYYGGTFNDNTKNMRLRSLVVDRGQIEFNRSSNELFPIINVTEGLLFGAGTVIVVPEAVKNFIPYRTPEGVPNDGKMFRVANLTGAAAANLPDVSDVKICYVTNTAESVGIGLRFYDGENGSKDLYIAASDVVAMTNDNIETTSGDKIQYGAFQSGHASDWTNLETPPSDSTLHYWTIKRLCFFQNAELPNATLTIDANSSWKDGARLTFKEINLLPPRSFGLWGGTAMRTLTANRLNIPKKNAAVEEATLYVFNGVTLKVNADVCGNCNLLLRNNSNTAGTIALEHINTNFHGRLTVQQKSDTTQKYRFAAILNDARNFGGAYTMDTNTYNAITFDFFPNISVTNDVAFTEPTRNMLITKGVQFMVNAGKILTLANQVTFAGEVVKAGAGTLELAGTTRFIDGVAATAPVATTNVLAVSAGALKVSSKTAADGLAVSFSEGTRLIVPADSEDGYYNVKWDAPLTINTTSGKLPVEVEMTGNEGTGDITVPICTFNATAAANIPETAFTVLRASNKFRLKAPVTKRTNGDGSVTYLATLGIVGSQFLIR